MEIKWTYNFLESIAFIGLSIIGLILVIRLVMFLYLCFLWKRG
jgi:membrane protein insertase Oxa1/YidC/SpoIIIJ